ncbi:MAG: tandem-95 repeat protein [Candidatus Omnitrophica bacterium]|nr:tandem-95 repeat protein [Candidatus Omnitrophota bacterium]
MVKKLAYNSEGVKRKNTEKIAVCLSLMLIFFPVPPFSQAADENDSYNATIVLQQPTVTMASIVIQTTSEYMNRPLTTEDFLRTGSIPVKMPSIQEPIREYARDNPILGISYRETNLTPFPAAMRTDSWGFVEGQGSVPGFITLLKEGTNGQFAFRYDVGGSQGSTARAYSFIPGETFSLDQYVTIAMKNNGGDTRARVQLIDDKWNYAEYVLDLKEDLRNFVLDLEDPQNTEDGFDRTQLQGIVIEVDRTLSSERSGRIDFQFAKETVSTVTNLPRKPEVRAFGYNTLERVPPYVGYATVTEKNENGFTYRYDLGAARGAAVDVILEKSEALMDLGNEVVLGIRRLNRTSNTEGLPSMTVIFVNALGEESVHEIRLGSDFENYVFPISFGGLVSNNQIEKIILRHHYDDLNPLTRGDSRFGEIQVRVGGLISSPVLTGDNPISNMDFGIAPIENAEWIAEGTIVGRGSLPGYITLFEENGFHAFRYDVGSSPGATVRARCNTSSPMAIDRFNLSIKADEAGKRVRIRFVDDSNEGHYAEYTLVLDNEFQSYALDLTSPDAAETEFDRTRIAHIILELDQTLTTKRSGRIDFRFFQNMIPVVENNPPVAQARTLQVNEEGTLNLTLSGTDEDGDTLTYVRMSQPQHGALECSGSQCTYIPYQDYYGYDSFSYVANDGEANSEAALVQITVNPVNDAPRILGDTLSLDQDTTATINLLLNDEDIDSPINASSLSITNQAAHGNINILTGGRISYVPATGYYGQDQFQYSVRDNEGLVSNIATVTINVRRVNPTPQVNAPLVIDHHDTDITQLTEEQINKAKELLHIVYGHTSHGSQLITGMSSLVTFANQGGLGLDLPSNIFSWNNGGTGGALDIHDRGMAQDVGYYPDWVNETREYLENPANSDVNVVIWSWCGQAAGLTEAQMQTQYLEPMAQFEEEYPDIVFVYMTGHVNGTGETGNLAQRNDQIRAFVQEGNRVLYDFADIESYDPDGNYYGDMALTDNMDYDSDGNGSRDSNWATDYANAHTQNVDWYPSSCAHSQSVNCNQKAYAAWALWVQIAELVEAKNIG